MRATERAWACAHIGVGPPPVASEACPVCATAFPVVLAASLVSEEDGQATLIFGGYGRQIEKWRGVFATRPPKRLGDLD